MTDASREQVPDVGRSDQPVPLGELLRLSFFAWLPLTFVVLLCAGIAGTAYRVYTAGRPWPGKFWWLVLFSAAAALAFTALLLAWRLINRTRGQPRWGAAVLVMIVALFAVLVWPTPYAYRRHPNGALFRVNRLTGVISDVSEQPSVTPAAAGPTAGSSSQ